MKKKKKADQYIFGRLSLSRAAAAASSFRKHNSFGIEKPSFPPWETSSAENTIAHKHTLLCELQRYYLREHDTVRVPHVYDMNISLPGCCARHFRRTVFSSPSSPPPACFMWLILELSLPFFLHTSNIDNLQIRQIMIYHTTDQTDQTDNALSTADQTGQTYRYLSTAGQTDQTDPYISYLVLHIRHIMIYHTADQTGQTDHDLPYYRSDRSDIS